MYQQRMRYGQYYGRRGSSVVTCILLAIIACVAVWTYMPTSKTTIATLPTSVPTVMAAPTVSSQSAPAVQTIPTAIPTAPAAAAPAVAEAMPTAAPEYVAVISQQADHSPRGDNLPTAVPEPPKKDLPVASQPASAASEPADVTPLPTLQPTQMAIVAERTSNQCPAGQKFYARSGCHVEGSAGKMSGAVGTK